MCELLQIPPTEFRDVQLHCPPSEPDQSAEEGLTLHSRSLCLKCRLSVSRACQLTKDATTDSMQGDERSHKQPSSEERVAVRKEALKLISKLSGDIAAKASKQGLKMYAQWNVLNDIIHMVQNTLACTYFKSECVYCVKPVQTFHTH